MFDVIVVGARCAGSSVAMLLARAGHRVLLVDRARFPSDTLSTHLLKPRAMAYLRRWGLRDRVADVTPVHSSFVFERDGLRLVGAPSQAALTRRLREVHGPEEPEMPVEVACVRRTILDAILVQAAEEAGVEVRTGCTLEGLERDGERVVGVRLSTSTGVHVERAKLVVGADGRRSRMREATGARKIAVGSTCTYTVYAYYEGIPGPLSRPGVHLNGRLGVGLGETNHGQTMISVFGPSDWFDTFRGDMDGNFLRTVERCAPNLAEAMRSGSHRVGRAVGTTDLENVMFQTHGPGWLLVGDAACHLDQCTAIGITHAFRDAALAGEWVSRGLSGELSMEAALDRYAAIREPEMVPQFEYVSMVSDCRVPNANQMAFFHALTEDGEALSRFLGFGASVVPKWDYFRPDEVDALVERGRSKAPEPAVWAANVAELEKNPWA